MSYGIITVLFLVFVRNAMGAYFQNYFPHLMDAYNEARYNINNNPDYCMIKLGIITENMARAVVERYGLPLAENTQLCRLNALSEHSLLPDDLADVFHDIRRYRNQASHEGRVPSNIAYNLFTWMDSLISWFENMMLQQHQPVYRQRHSTYGIGGIPIELIAYVGVPAVLMIFFFGSIIFSYIVNRIIKYIVPIVLILAATFFIVYRIKSGKWMNPLKKPIEKLKSTGHRISTVAKMSDEEFKARFDTDKNDNNDSR